VGEFHFKTGLSPHYVQASTKFVRSYLMSIINKEMGTSAETNRILISINEALDISLDIMINSFREEELRLYHTMGKYQKLLIENVKRISWFFDFFIVFTLAVVGAFLIVWIIYEIGSFLRECCLWKGAV
jgi:hypothetical protein